MRTSCRVHQRGPFVYRRHRGLDLFLNVETVSESLNTEEIRTHVRTREVLGTRANRADSRPRPQT